MDDNAKIQASAANNLTKAETEAIIGRKMTSQECQLYNKTKAVVKLKDKAKADVVQETQTADGRLPSIKERYTKAQVKEAIERCNGRWAAICAALNCSYAQLRVWFTNHRDQAKLADDLRQAFVDEAENQVWNLLHSPDANMRADIAKFVLKTYGKSRGWGDIAMMQQINVDDKDITIQQIFGI